eukprot:jgi/Undpi1/7039/HiC_scaffold_21.g09513.m1
MKRHALATGGSLLSLGIVWSQAMCAKARTGQGQVAFAAAPAAPSTPTPPVSKLPKATIRGGANSNDNGRGGGRGWGGGEEGRRRRVMPKSQIIFVGTGSSTAVPSAFHLLHPELDDRKSALAQLAVSSPPESNKNYRTMRFTGLNRFVKASTHSFQLRGALTSPASVVSWASSLSVRHSNVPHWIWFMVLAAWGNTSVVVRVVKDRRDGEGGQAGGGRENDPSSEEVGGGRGGGEEGRGGGDCGIEVKHVQIDTGKTWREGIIRWFPRHNVKSLDGIVLTHDHADAMLGLDDVRGLQNSKKVTAMPVHVSERTDKAVKRVFPYLVGREEDNGAGGRFVASLTFSVFQDFQPFQVGGLEITPFPVLHGEDYVSHGFLFGPEGNKICYISDVSRVPPESMEFLRSHGPIQLLVCDALMRTVNHPTHFSVEDSVALAGKLRARRTLLVGLGNDIEYHSTNAQLEIQEEEAGAPNVRLAHDGLAVDIDLQ